MLTLGLGLSITGQNSSGSGGGGDTTPPVFSNQTWNNGTSTATFDISEVATMYICWHDSAVSPVLNANGTWTGTITESDTIAITGSDTYTAEDTILSVAADRMTYDAIDAAGNVSTGSTTVVFTSALVSEPITVIDSGGIIMRALSDPPNPTTTVEWELTINIPASYAQASTEYLIYQANRGFEFEMARIRTDGIRQGRIEDGSGNIVTYNGDSVSGSIYCYWDGSGGVERDVPKDEWLVLKGVIDYVAGTNVITNNGVIVHDGRFVATNKRAEDFEFRAFSDSTTSGRFAGVLFKKWSMKYGATQVALVEGDAAAVNGNAAVTVGTVSDVV